jgi:hypothetical protein
VKRAWQVLGLVLVLPGVFWAGREGGNGLAAFSEHWWCPIPLAMIVVGVLSVITAQVQRPAA